MKKKNIITLLGAAAAVSLSLGSCSDVLDEHPRAIFTPDFFGTDQGISGGLDNMYNNLRNMYGQGYYYSAVETGTDEFTWGESADANFKDADHSEGAATLNSQNSRADVIWQPMITNINSANQLIEYGQTASPELIAEAYFFRAFDYFLLVQTFGGVPLDFGSGELKPNDQPVRSSVRNNVAEVYTRCILPDLEYAANNLPETPRALGTASKTLASLYLAKAYLTYGWWLENPKNIPTYPAVDGQLNGSRKDPNGKTPAEYFQLAYNVALEAINNPGPYALQETFYDMCIASNERNPEMMLWADHTEKSELFNGGSLTYGSGAAPDNFAFWMCNWNYPTVVAFANTELDENGKMTEPINPVAREAKQGYGRPWTRMAPTYNVFTETFADKTHDSRYDATFQTVYRANWNQDGKTYEQVYCANGMPIKIGDAVLTFLGEDTEGINYADAATNGGDKGLGVMAGESSYVVDQQHFSRLRYPGPFKISDQRTDYDTKTSLGSPNAGSVRPYYIAKFSELYLVAAEAAVKGATGEKSARDLVNVLRARAGKWSYSVAGAKAVSFDYSKEMTAATPATIDIDYILAERSREFFGEGYRWYDLVRTQTWIEKAKTYKICGSKVTDTELVEYTRDLDEHLYLFPIPQGQLDGLEMSEEEIAAYQNPGY